VVFHFGGSALASFPVLRDIRAGGFIGVSFFFVLSGFVLAYNYEGVRAAGVSWVRRFAVARAARIYPVYVLSLAIMVPVDFWNSWAQTNFGHAILHTGLGLALTLTMIQSWLPGHSQSINPPAWSLSDEAFFYLIFPMLLGFLARVRTLRTICLLAVGVFILQLAAVLLLAPYFGADVSFPPARLAEFFAGVVGGLIFLRYRWRFSSTWAVLLFGVSVGLIVFAMSLRDRVPGVFTYGGGLTPLFAATVFMLAVVSSRIPTFWAGRGSVFLGEASYALYLLHVPVFAWVAIVLRAPATGPQFNVGGFIIYLTLVIALSAAVYQWFERPLRLRVKTVAATWAGHHVGTVPVKSTI
jgi:peptidoglycan/LPS O-acetylase OafA/YrhL